MNVIPILAVLALLIPHSIAMAQTSTIVKVAVTTASDSSGFVDKAAKARTQAVKDITAQLQKKKKTIGVVESPADADVIVDVIVSEEAEGAAETKPNYLGGGVTTKNKKEWVVTAKLSLGDYSTELKKQAVFPVLAAAGVADQAEKWVKENLQSILAKRKQ